MSKTDHHFDNNQELHVAKDGFEAPVSALEHSETASLVQGQTEEQFQEQPPVQGQVEEQFQGQFQHVQPPSSYISPYQQPYGSQSYLQGVSYGQPPYNNMGGQPHGYINYTHGVNPIAGSFQQTTGYVHGQQPPQGQGFVPVSEKTNNYVAQPSKISSGWKTFIIATAVCLASVLLTLAVVGVLGFSGKSNFLNDNLSDPAAADSATELQEIIHLLRENYYHELSDEEILEAMIAGLPANLDSIHTYYIPPDELSAFLESQESSYAGIGATVQEISGGHQGVAIADIIPNSPAEQAGLQIGDIFIAVDGEKISNRITSSDLATLVRGVPDSTVELTMFRPAEQQELNFKIKRGVVQQEIVKSHMITDTVGYLSISSFTDDVFGMFKEHMDQLVSEGAEQVIFDLRNNPGGSASAVSDMLDYLLPKDTKLVEVEGREDGNPYTDEWTADDPIAVPEDMNYAILLNGNSASASELFSGCLRDHGKAILVGEQSYGKGTGTVMLPLLNGGGLNVTTFAYVLPGGERIEGVGLTPDIEVELPIEYATVPISRLEPKDDTQLLRAFNELTGGKTYPLGNLEINESAVSEPENIIHEQPSTNADEENSSFESDFSFRRETYNDKNKSHMIDKTAGLMPHWATL